jgi:hypothetical protein
MLHFQIPVPKFPFGSHGNPRKPNPIPIAFSITTTTSRSRGPTSKDQEPATTTSKQGPPAPTLRPYRNHYQQQQDANDMQVVVNFTQYCPPSTARGLFWNWTKAVSLSYLNLMFGKILNYGSFLLIDLTIPIYLFVFILYMTLFCFQGDTAVLQCPSGSTGFAKWHCGQHSRWATQAPTFAECRSLWLGDLDAR